MSASATASTEGNLPYAHLHVHTEYSMLDGAARFKELFKEVKALGMTHVAMTDHGNLFGAAEFYRQAMDAGITPVIGIEAYVAPERRDNPATILWGQPHQKKDDVSASGAYVHKTIWARNNEGLHNLFKISSRSFAEGWLTKWARMDKELISEYAGGPDGVHRLPVGRGADQAPARPAGRGAQGRRRVAGHLRRGELLPRADGPRPRDRDAGPRRPARHREEAEHPAGRHQRHATTRRRPTPRRRNCCCASRPAQHGRRGPVQVRRHRLLHQAGQRDVRDQQQRRLAARAAATPSCSSPTGSTPPGCSSSRT